jgi:hypothetical protein
MKSDTKFCVMSSNIENQIFMNKNVIEHIYDTVIKFDVQTS